MQINVIFVQKTVVLKSYIFYTAFATLPPFCHADKELEDFRGKKAQNNKKEGHVAKRGLQSLFRL